MNAMLQSFAGRVAQQNQNQLMCHQLLQMVGNGPEGSLAEGNFPQHQGVQWERLGALGFASKVCHQERLRGELPELDGHRIQSPKGELGGCAGLDRDRTRGIRKVVEQPMPHRRSGHEGRSRHGGTWGREWQWRQRMQEGTSKVEADSGDGFDGPYAGDVARKSEASPEVDRED